MQLPADLTPPRRRPRLVRWLAPTLLAFTGVASAAVTIEITGVEGEFAGVARDNLELSQYLTRELSAAQLRRLARAGEDEIRRGLEPWGYYDVKVTSELQQNGADTKAIYHVTLGERVIVRSEKVEVGGEGWEIQAVKDAVLAFEPRVDEALDHWLYELRKTEITTALQSRGFLDTELTKHRVEVTRASRSATIDLEWQTGQRYRMGDVSFTGNQLPAEFLDQYIPWKPESFYSVEELLRFQQRLVDADYFSIVSVTPQLEKRADGHVPVDVQLLPAKRNIYTASAFISTDTGPGGKLGVQRRWLNDEGHKAGVQLEYATRLEAYSVYYRIPRPGVRNRLYSATASYRDETTDSWQARLARLGVNEQLDDWHGYARTLGVQYLDGEFVLLEEATPTRLLYAEGLLTRRRADDLLFPSRGVSVTYTARASAGGLLSDTNLASVRADLKWVRPAGDRSRLILRASGGALQASRYDSLPPELRFFAGGDRSVRGFDYQQIGERRPIKQTVLQRLQQLNPDKEYETTGVIGGHYLITASSEFEHYFTDQWGAAVFVDAGDAFDSKPNANVGAGVGVRWKSPVGIIRVDFAVPVRTDNDTDSNGLRFHIMIGPDL
ncbi:MAG: autotransporter assembly complex family protein [Steroidobacteraceae bacterium]